jgi:hypothetical protein
MPLELLHLSLVLHLVRFELLDLLSQGLNLLPEHLLLHVMCSFLIMNSILEIHEHLQERLSLRMHLSIVDAVAAIGPEIICECRCLSECTDLILESSLTCLRILKSICQFTLTNVFALKFQVQ